jgi:8-oxo-dGTP diphosphatase
MISCNFENGSKASLRHVTVDTIVLNADKTQILLAKRAAGQLEAGKWCLPGGYMDRDETTAQTAAREVYEETGYDLFSIVFIKFNDNPDRPGEDRQNINFLYSAVANKQIGTPDDESSEIDWFHINNLPDKSQFAFDHFEAVANYL